MKRRRARRGKWLSAVMILLYLSMGGLYLYSMADQSDTGESPAFPSAPSVNTASALISPREKPAAEPEPPAAEEAPAAIPVETPPEAPAEKEEGLPELRSPVQITAHRGDSANRPENTLLAFQSALDSGADWVELDVQASSDGELMVFHDESMKRMTGLSGKLWDYTAQELAGMDVGSRMGFPEARIPRLSEVLAFCRDRIRMNIEIKENPHSIKAPITVQTVKLIEEYGVEDQCVITAYMQKTLKLVKELNPRIQTALLCDRDGRFFYDAAEVDEFSAVSNVLTKEIVENAHAAGKTVTAWVADSQDQVLRLAAMGVDNIMSSDPAMTHRYLYGEEGFFTKLAAGEERSSES